MEIDPHLPTGDDTPALPVAPTTGTEADGSPFIAFYRPTRLGISHLLAWTAVAAVLMSITMSIRSLAEGSSHVRAAAVSAESSADGLWAMKTIVLAGGLVGAFVLVRDRRRGATGYLQPGHWILAAECTRGAINTLCQAAVQILLLVNAATMSLSRPLLLVYVAPQLLQFALVALIYLAGAIRCPAGRLWRAMFGLCAIGAVVAALFAVCFMLGQFGLSGVVSRLQFLVVGVAILHFAPVVLLAIAAVRDLRRRERRDWLHWLGIALVLTTTLLPLLSRLWYTVARIS